MKKITVFSALLLATSLVYADQQRDEFNAWRNKELKSYQSYLDENDKAFVKFLKGQWQAVNVKPAEQGDPEPKPKTLPKAPIKKPEPDHQKPALFIQPQPEIPAKPPVKQTPITQAPTKQAPITQTRPTPTSTPAVKQNTDLTSRATRTAKFNFYGHAITITYAKNFKRIFAGKLSSDNIAAYWQYLASKEHKPTIAQLKQTAAKLKLNDWGTALLFDRFAGSLLRQQTSRRLTTWFLLVKAGFDARIAYNKQLYLLMPSQQELFGVTYFTLQGKRYYAINLHGKALKPGKVFTYNGQHESGAKTLDFSQPNEFIVLGKQQERELQFSYAGKHYQLTVDYPERYIGYFNSYPQLALPNYFKAGLPAVTAQSLLDQLRPIISGRSEQEAVNRLLRFVQTAFKYQTDDQQFNEENYLFPLETLHYPYSDCEDRAALFAWLVESLLGLDVIILNYPGHVSTAVHFNNRVKGDAWQYQGKRYVVADPTYVNASAGMTMPQFASKAPNVEPF